ncbi:MAG TPA: hypothetical protein PKK10_11625 [Woeseiaceae bacterium]|nr:hypothetical protein [Woeseiaceae bacterium]
MTTLTVFMIELTLASAGCFIAIGAWRLINLLRRGDRCTPSRRYWSDEDDK